MIGKNQRISKNRVAWLLKKGRKLNDEHFSVKFELNKGKLNRYSIVVSKKILKLATDRNLLRRQIYSVFNNPAIANSSTDFVIFVKSSLLNLDFQQLQDKLIQLVEKINSQKKL